MFRGISFRSAALVVTFVVMVHLVVVVALSRNTTDGIIESHSVSQAELKLPLGHIPAAHHMDRLQPTTSRKILESAPVSPLLNIAEQCVIGHVAGLPPKCDSHGCLQKLREPNARHQRTIDDRTLNSMARRKISFLESTMDNIHMSVLLYITQMQWIFGVYGSVAELGNIDGKFCSVLVHCLNIEAGERIFVSGLNEDIEKQSTSSEDGSINLGDIMQMWNMKVLNIEDYDLDNLEQLHENVVHQHHGAPLDFSKHVFIRLGIPQFRLIGLSYDDLDAIMGSSQSLENVLCVMREGAIVVIDGIESNESIGEVLTLFFDRYGTDILSPLMLFNNKLYLCTSSHLERYKEYLMTSERFTDVYEFQETRDVLYGQMFQFLSR